MGKIADISEVLLVLGLDSSCTERERAVADWSLNRAEAAVMRFLRYNPAQESRTNFYPLQDFGQGSREAVWEATSTEAYLRYLSEASTNELLTMYVPIRSSPAIQLYIDYDARSGTRSGAFAAETLKVEGTDYWPNYDGQDSDGNKLCRDGMIRSIGRWPTTAGSVKFVATTGYSAEELHGQDSVIDASMILDAVVEEAARRVKSVMLKQKSTRLGWTSGPFSSENLGDYSYSVGLPGEALDRMFGSKFSLLPESKEKLADYVHMAEFAL